jgi:hypothetical protein
MLLLLLLLLLHLHFHYCHVCDNVQVPDSNIKKP